MRLVMRLLVVAAALGLPVIGAGLILGIPTALELEALDQWSPFRQPGPTASLMAQVLASVAISNPDDLPEWFDDDMQKLVNDAKQAVRNSNLKQAAGHLLVLSDRLEEHDVSFENFLSIVLPGIVPELIAWLLANYFSPVLLGLLMITVTVLLLGPWLIRQIYLLLKALLTLAIAAGIAFLIVVSAFALSSHQSLVFALIEYLAAVSVLLSVLLLLGHLILARCYRGQAREKPGLGKSLTRSQSHHSASG